MFSTEQTCFLVSKRKLLAQILWLMFLFMWNFFSFLLEEDFYGLHIRHYVRHYSPYCVSPKRQLSESLYDFQVFCNLELRKLCIQSSCF